MTTPLLNNVNANVFYKIVETMGNASLGLQLCGEKGLGKEAIVRLLYASSPHRGFPFIKVNCPVLGADDETDTTPCHRDIVAHPDKSSFNLFRLFHRGVLYLHAVDELDMRLQGRLLSLIKRKLPSPFPPAGAPTRGILVFATSTRSLDACVAAGTFNPALGELLSGLSIHIPALRNSPERIPPLVDYFLNRFIPREGLGGLPRPSVAHLAKLRTHLWPDNLKELQEVVKTALRLNDWDSAISMLKHRQHPLGNYSTVDLTPDGVALMPDFEIRQRCTLERLAARLPDEEMGLMDLVIYEEAMSYNKMQ